MSAAFHRGITQLLRRRLQTAGIRIEEQDAQKALAGATVVGLSSPAQDTVREISQKTWTERFATMLKWESDHPGENPFPPTFAQTVLDLCRNSLEAEDLTKTILEVIKLAEAELEL